MITVKKELFWDQEIFHLKNDNLEIWINPDEGMNLCKACYCGQTVIDSDRNRFEAGSTYGTALLYPTPNRVRDERFVYSGKVYPAQMHGVVRKTAFQVTDCKEEDSAVYLEGQIAFSKGNELYEKFPFESTLTIKISLFSDEIRINYTVDNKDDNALPFGLGVHPFFQKISAPVTVCVNAKTVMETSAENYPTGKLKLVEGTSFDLRKDVPVEELNLDHVYTSLTGHPQAVIKYPEFTVSLDSSEDFSHLVVFTPQGKNFFCLENQTCSTDAHNLYAAGFQKESGLLIVSPKTQQNGEIRYKFEK